MIKIFLILILLAFTVGVKAQKVEVTQEFINDATRAFDLVVEQRKAIDEFLKERAKTDAERVNAQILIKGFDELIAIKDKSISALEKLNVIYEKVIQMQFDIIEKLEKRLMKPRSFFQKFLQGLKEVALIVVGVAVGRGF